MQKNRVRKRFYIISYKYTLFDALVYFAYLCKNSYTVRLKR